MTDRPTEAEARARASEIATIAMETALYAPIDVAVEKALHAGGPSREEVKAKLLAYRYGEQAAS